MNKLWVCLVSMLVTASGVMPAMAQTGDVGYELEEVVVTAELREVNLQKVSTSIQVTSGDELRREGKRRIDEIMAGAVGIQTQDSQNGVTFFVRGVDSGGTGGVNSTPVLVDGVAQSRGEAVRGGTLDLARAEVMRGPQSTTLGANALSGAVSLVSNKPVFQYESSASLDVGNYHKATMEGVMNVPLSDNQAIRIAYSSEKRDGYYSNGAGESDLRNLRFKYRWQPSNDLDIVSTFSHQNIGGNGVSQLTLLTYGQYRPWVSGGAYTQGSTLNELSKCWSNSSASNHTLVNCDQSTLGLLDPANSVTFIGCTPYYGGATLNAAGVPATSTLQTTLGGTPDILGGCTPTFYPYNDGTNFRTRKNAWDDGSKRNAWANVPYRNSNIEQASVEINWTTDIGTVTFLPSWQYTHFTSQEPYRAYQSMGADNYQRTKIADLRINSPNGDKLQWQAGYYYSDDRQDNRAITTNLPGIGMGMNGTFNVGDCNIGWNGSAYTQASNGTSPAGTVIPLVSNTLCYSYQDSPKADRKSKAVYANGEYSVLDTLRLIGGFRYNEATQEGVQYTIINGNVLGPYQACPTVTATGQYNIQCTPATTPLNAALNNEVSSSVGVTNLANTNTRWAHTTYRAGLEWDVLPETMLYGVYSTGFNPGAFDAMNQNAPSKAVTLEQVTAGFKSQALDNRLQVNGEAFLTTYHNRAIDGNVISAVPIGNVPASFASCTVGMGQSGVSLSTDGFAYCLGLGTPTMDKFKSKGVDLDLTWLLSPNDRIALTGEWMEAVYNSAPRVLTKPTDIGMAANLVGGLTCTVGTVNPTTSAANCPTVAGTPIYLNGHINPAYVAALADSAAGVLNAVAGGGWTGDTQAAIDLASNFDDQLNSFIGTGLQNAPKFSATWNYSHNFILPSGNRITPRISGAYKTRYWSLGGGGPGNSGVNVIARAGRDPSSPYYLAWQQAYATWDFTTAWDKADGKFTVTGYVRNLTNEVVMSGYTYQYVSLAAPRTWGATFVANF